MLSPSRSRRHAQLVEQRQVQIRQRRAFGGIAEVTSALQLAGAAAGQQDRQVVRIVRVAVAHAGAVDQRDVIEQRAVAVGRRLQLLEVSRRTASV